ncbi:unnamed protein product [Merluccius merluccius]
MFPRRMLGNGKEDRGVWDMVFKVLKLGILLTAGAPGVSVPRHNPGLSGSFRSDTVNEHSHPNALEETGAGKAPIMVLRDEQAFRVTREVWEYLDGWVRRASRGCPSSGREDLLASRAPAGSQGFQVFAETTHTGLENTLEDKKHKKKKTTRGAV